jgi:uncharacterized integral membrane protein
VTGPDAENRRVTTPQDGPRPDPVPPTQPFPGPDPVHPTTPVPPRSSEPDPVPARPVEPTPARPTGRSARPTRISGTWVAVVTAMVVLAFLLVFILQNLDGVTVRFLGMASSLPLGIALLFATIGGAALVALIGGARILQLRRHARRAGTRR